MGSAVGAKCWRNREKALLCEGDFWGDPVLDYGPARMKRVKQVLISLPKA